MVAVAAAAVVVAVVVIVVAVPSVVLVLPAPARVFPPLRAACRCVYSRMASRKVWFGIKALLASRALLFGDVLLPLANQRSMFTLS